MASSLRIRLPGYVSTSNNKTRMVIRTIDGKWIYRVRMAPKEIDHTNFGSQWSEVAVPGGPPFLVKESFGLKKIAFSIIVANPNNQDADMTHDLQVLKAFADTVRPIKIAYDGYFTSWTFRCTSLSIHSEQRHPASNKITRATVDLEFTEKRDVADFTGPITGGAKSNPSSNTAARSGGSNRKKTTTKKTATRTKTKIYVVKQGDTLWGIAYKLFGDGSKWRQLADDNGIKNPRKLPTGKRLKY